MKTLRLPLVHDISNKYCTGYYYISNEFVELTANDINRLLNKDK